MKKENYKAGVELIADERKRQIEVEGYNAEHDKKHHPMDFVCAADAYIQSAEGFASPQGRNIWPWDLRYFKPKTIREDLIRAGALIAAALDRLSDKGD